MLKNYFKIAFRNLLKYKFISSINLFGLTVGLSCCLLILSYIINEVSYDKYNEKAERTYRVTRSFFKQDKTVSLHLASVAPPFGLYIKNDIPAIELMTRLLPNRSTALRYNDKNFNEKNVFWADENLFNVFTQTIVRGNPKTALADPYTAMLTEEMAKKYFGNDDPMNKVLRLGGQFQFKVTGIYKKFPSSSHIHPEILLSFNSLKDTLLYGERALQTNWSNNAFLTYLVFPKNYPVKQVEAQLSALIDRHMDRTDMPAGLKPSGFTKLYLQKLTDIHLKSHLDDEVEENGDITRVYIFSAIALFILLIACINYMNLSTARSVLRSKEIGIRKVVGAQRKEIIVQFLSESILITAFALILAVLITWITLPLLNQLSGQDLRIQLLNKWYIVLPVLLTPLIIGIFSGIYPALFMSSFKPIKVLKGIFKVENTQISFRKALVVVQFAISIILIISTVIILKQLSYMQIKNLGYNKEQVVTIAYPAALNDNYESFRNELLSNNSIKNVARSSRIPTGRLLDAMGTRTVTGDTTAPVDINLKFLRADYDFIPVYNISMAEGRNFSREYGADTSGAFIINAEAAKLLGWGKKGEAIGKDLVYGDQRAKIIGVMNDFHFETLHEKISAMILLLPPPSRSRYSYISVKISANNIKASLDHIAQTWRRMLPETPYEYTFLNERFGKLYDTEQKQASAFTIFSFIAIFIACLGLLGLSAFTITQRIKEIGIRKVLGASIASIVALLSKDFMKLVAMASLIAFPIAWYAMHNWLQDFAYRINIPWWAFILAGVLAAVIALATISIQAIKAAIANPVKSLRTE